MSADDLQPGAKVLAPATVVRRIDAERDGDVPCVEASMRIALTGAHSTGKSTLARVLAQRLDLPYVEESARRAYAALGYESADQSAMPPSERLLLQEHVLQEHERGINAAGCGFVTDRFEADVLAYTLYWLDREPCALAFIGHLRDLVAVRRRQYDHVILVHPGIPLVADGLRVPAQGHQWSIHYLIAGILRDAGYSVVEMRETDHAARLQRALHAVKGSEDE